jgi:hypothetical protein
VETWDHLHIVFLCFVFYFVLLRMHRFPFSFLYTPNRIQFLSEEHLHIFKRAFFSTAIIEVPKCG